MRFWSVLLLLLLSVSSHAQQGNRQDLEKRRQQIMEEIKRSQVQLTEIKKNKNATVSQLRALQAKLNARQKLIDNINSEIGALNRNIASSASEINALNSKLAVLKSRYAQSVRYAYKNRSSYSMLAFLFSAKSFNDATRRMKYMKRYRDYRTHQVAQIKSTQARISKELGILNNEKSRKDLLRVAEENQRQQLQSETNETNNVVKELRGQESKLMADIRKKQKSVNQVNKVINDLIKRDIELARKKAEEERKREEAARRQREEQARRQKEEQERLERERLARAATPATGTGGVKVNTGSGTVPASSTTTPAATTGPAVAAAPAAATPTPAATPPKPAAEKPARASVNLGLTPEAAELSANFAASRGRLPWPVEKGAIIGRFGSHPHPVYDKVTVENMGVDIQTTGGATARAVYSGTVTGLMTVPGMGQIVLINHGEYYSAYANLASVSVKRGDKVSTKQAIGIVGNNEDGVPVINFQIWKGSVKVDPEGWIAR